ncbi:hypothetical protein [Aquisphaera insulae]|uniref:hypothetical protein n=1 Tax=Aquisphaera insulae TaxID=2712864 RepID=UPI0013EB5B56|nr:hypothetical protein [Aquisphaera insulae]
MSLSLTLLLFLSSQPAPGRAGTISEREVWDIIRSPDGDIAFSMPSRPDRETRNARGTEGPLEILSYSCSVDGVDYRLQRIRAPRAIPPNQILPQLDLLKPRYLTVGTRLIKESPIVVDGVIGDDLTYVPPSPPHQAAATLRTRHFMRGSFYYALTVTSQPGKPLPDSAARFLASLTFEAVVREHQARMKAPSSSPDRSGTGPQLSPSRPGRPASRVPGNPAVKPRVQSSRERLDESWSESIVSVNEADSSKPDEENPRQ